MMFGLRAAAGEGACSGAVTAPVAANDERNVRRLARAMVSLL